MKVWLVNHYAITPEQSGGTRHFSFAQRLKARGHEPTIVASNYDHFNSKFRHEPNDKVVVEEFEGVRFVWVPTRSYQGNGKGRAMNMLDFARGISQMAGLPGLGRPDVILGSSPHLFTPFMAQRMARKLGVPFVLEIRDVWPQTLVDLGNFSEGHPMIRVLSWMEKRLYRTADHIVSLLPGAADHCVALGADRERITWIPNGIDLSLVPDMTEPGEGGGDFTLMFAGAHGLANGLDTVLDAAKLTAGDGIKFRLMGDGPAKKGLMERAESESIQNVEFYPSVPKREVYTKLSEADAFLMMLKGSDVFRWGVSPNKLFDYMAVGRPVVFGVNSSNSPVEAAGCGLRIPPDDPGALADAARRLSSLSSEDRTSMAKAGRAYVEENHSFEVLTDRLEKVFADLISANLKA